MPRLLSATSHSLAPSEIPFRSWKESSYLKASAMLLPMVKIPALFWRTWGGGLTSVSSPSRRDTKIHQHHPQHWLTHPIMLHYKMARTPTSRWSQENPFQYQIWNRRAWKSQVIQHVLSAAEFHLTLFFCDFTDITWHRSQVTRLIPVLIGPSVGYCWAKPSIPPAQRFRPIPPPPLV